MKKLIFAVLLVGVLPSSADPPRKDSLTKYRQLWEASLVTVKPEIIAPEGPDETTPLDDYTLGGYTRTPQGYFVSLINTKDPADRLTIAPGVPGSQAYEVLEVKTDPTNFTSAQVLIKIGSQQKWLGYDEKYLVLRQPAQAKPAPNPGAQSRAKPPIPTNNSKNNSNSQARAPRVRRVPVPPTK